MRKTVFLTVLKPHKALKTNIIHYIKLASLLLCTCLFWGCKEEADPEVVVEISAADGTVYPRTNGLLSGLFDVGNGKNVRFSHGNLQYRPSTNEWRLAPNQYDRTGSRNHALSPTSSQWFDLFSWGTSGCDPYITPYSVFHNTDTLFLQSNLQTPVNLYDWGLFNHIPNAGDSAGWLRTLTSSQWNHLLNQRYFAKERRGVAKVEGVMGYILLPDFWILPEGCSFVPDTASDSSSTVAPFVNVYDKTLWQRMEVEGAVFLPFCGERNGRNVTGTDKLGSYWTITSYRTSSGLYRYVNFNKKSVLHDHWSKGFAVRPVYFEQDKKK